MSQRFLGTLKLAAGLAAVLIHVAGTTAPSSIQAASAVVSQAYTQADSALRRMDRFAEVQRLFGEAHRAS